MNINDIKINEIFDISKTKFSFLFDNLVYPYDVLPLISKHFEDCVKMLDMNEYNRIKDGVYVHKSVTILKSVYLGHNIIIGKDCEIRNSALLRENIIIGDNCLVGNSGELKNVLMFDESKIAHFNYCGDTILGNKSHLGAGVITSNLKLDKTIIKIKIGDELIDTKLKKFGAIIGDNVEIGCNTVLNPGTIVCKNVSIYPLSNVRGVVPKDSIYKTQNEIKEKNYER